MGKRKNKPHKRTSKPKGKFNKKKHKSNFNRLINNCRDDQLNTSNKLENRISKILDDLEIEYEEQKVFKKGKQFYIVDFYLKEFNLVLECDGSYHDSDKAKIRDAKRTKWIIENTEAVDVLRVHYTQFFSHNREENTEGLIRFLENL